MTITLGTPVTFETGATSRVALAKLSTTKYIVAYRDAGNGGRGTACILDISGKTVTAGTPVAFGAGNTRYISIDALDSSKAIVAYQDQGVSSHGRAVILSVSGTTITVNAAKTFEAAATGGIGISTLSSTKGIVGYTDGGNGGRGTAVVLDVSGTAIEVRTPAVFQTNAVDNCAIVKMTDSSTIVTYEDETNSHYFTANLLYSITGTGFSAGPDEILDSTRGSFDNIGSNYLAGLDSNRAIAAYQDTTDFDIYTVAMSISGTSVIRGTPINFSASVGLGGELPGICALSDRRAFVSFSDFGDFGHGQIGSAEIAGTMITDNNDEVSIVTGSTMTALKEISSTDALLAYSDNSDSDRGKAVVAAISQAIFYHGLGHNEGALEEKFTLPFVGVSPGAMTLDKSLGNVVIGTDEPTGIPVIYSPYPYETGTTTSDGFPTGTSVSSIKWI